MTGAKEDQVVGESLSRATVARHESWTWTGRTSGEQRILMFQLESYPLSGRFTVAMGPSRQLCWVVRGSSKLERGLSKGMSHGGHPRRMSPLEFSAPP